MPMIAPQHANDPHVPAAEWPDDCRVQWGRRGIVLKKGSDAYATAFFEAFPAGGGFIRGEGASVEAAEAAALEEYRRASACDHRWGRSGYTNGGGRCRRCGTFRASAFRPILTLGAWRAPLKASEIELILMGALRPDADDCRGPDQIRYRRKLELRARQQGIALPSTPETPAGPLSLFGMDPDPYENACRRAIAAWWRAHRATESVSGSHTPDDPVPGGIADLFDHCARRTLDRLVEEEDAASGEVAR